MKASHLIASLFFPGMFLLSGVSCSTTENTGASVTEGSEVTLSDILEDPYFQKKPGSGEYFRVLITPDYYIARQVSGETAILREEDPTGDQEQLKQFNEVGKELNFKDWTFQGLIRVGLDQDHGNVNHIEYVPGQSPRTWQVSRMLQEDVSRYMFEEAVKGRKLPGRFLIRYEWRIPAEEGLSKEEAITRARAYIRKYGKKK